MYSKLKYLIKKKQVYVCQLHHYDDKCMSVTGIKKVLSDELDEAVPDADSDYSIGYFERWHQKKRWLANGEDLAMMYQK